MVSVMIGSIAVSHAYRQDQHQHLLISHLINQAESGGTELDLVAVCGSAQFAPQWLRVKGQIKGLRRCGLAAGLPRVSDDNLVEGSRQTG